MRRRQLLQWGVLAAVATSRPLRAAMTAGTPLATALAALEREHGGRLGVAVLDSASGRHDGWRGDQRFLMCSTFKLLLVARVLARVDCGQERLDRHVLIRPGELQAYAPVTRHHVGSPGMRVEALCAAALTLSDNTAANALLETVGGPAAVTAFVRTLGDRITRLDRCEPALNVSAGPHDVRDTTTPFAMLRTTRRLLLGPALTASSRVRLLAWMRACRTGTTLLHAGLPPGWRSGDKSGSGAADETNDVAILWPPRRPPQLVTAFYRPPHADSRRTHRVLAAVGRLVAGF